MKQKVKVLFVVVMILALLFSMNVIGTFAEEVEWVYKEPMPTQRYAMSSGVVDSKIYVIGGYGSAYLGTVEIYDPVTDTWSTGANMPTARYAMTSAVVDGKIYAIGGNSASSGYLNKVYIYDPATDVWSTGPNLQTRRQSHISEVVDGMVYVIGGNGSGSGYLSSVEALDLNSPRLAVLLNVSETVQLSVTRNLTDNANFMWSSTNPTVAMVNSNGKVTAVSPGVTDIYAESIDSTFSEFIPVRVI